MIQLCTPSIIYLIFSITQILIDLYKGLYNTVAMKIIVASMVTLLLNILCERGLSFVSWIIVFIPFILMTLIVTMLLYIFGLDAASGTLDYTCKSQNSTNTSNTSNTSNTTSTTNTTNTTNTYPEELTIDEYGNIIIYDPEYNPSLHPVYYQSPNIIVPNPKLNNPVTQPVVNTYNAVPYWSSGPEYQS
jgi:hypothetical protein